MEERKVKGLTKKQKERVREQAKVNALKKMGVKDEEIKSVLDAMEEIKAPIVLKDSDIVMGDGEVDVRKLSEASFRQLMFRTEVSKIATLRSIDSNCVDIMRLLMIVLDKLGVENIEEAMIKLTENLTNIVKKETKPNEKA